jgi:hypothetical protein
VRSIGVAAVIAAVIFAGIYLTVAARTGDIGMGNIAIALGGALVFAMIAGLIGAAVRRSRRQ